MLWEALPTCAVLPCPDSDKIHGSDRLCREVEGVGVFLAATSPFSFLLGISMLGPRHKGSTKPWLGVLHCRGSMKEREKLMMALCVVGTVGGYGGSSPCQHSDWPWGYVP